MIRTITMIIVRIQPDRRLCRLGRGRGGVFCMEDSPSGRVVSSIAHLGGNGKAGAIFGEKSLTKSRDCVTLSRVNGDD